MVGRESNSWWRTRVWFLASLSLSLSRHPVPECCLTSPPRRRRKRWHFPFFRFPAFHFPSNNNHSLPLSAAEPPRWRRSSRRRLRAPVESITSFRLLVLPLIRSQSMTDKEESFTSLSYLRYHLSHSTFSLDVITSFSSILCCNCVQLIFHLILFSYHCWILISVSVIQRKEINYSCFFFL